MKAGKASWLIGYELWEKEGIRDSSPYISWPHSWEDNVSMNKTEKGCRRNRFVGKVQTPCFGGAENELYLTMRFQVEISSRQRAYSGIHERGMGQCYVLKNHQHTHTWSHHEASQGQPQEGTSTKETEVTGEVHGEPDTHSTRKTEGLEHIEEEWVLLCHAVAHENKTGTNSQLT